MKLVYAIIMLHNILSSHIQLWNLRIFVEWVGIEVYYYLPILFHIVVGYYEIICWNINTIQLKDFIKSKYNWSEKAAPKKKIFMANSIVQQKLLTSNLSECPDAGHSDFEDC